MTKSEATVVRKIFLRQYKAEKTKSMNTFKCNYIFYYIKGRVSDF